MRRVARVKKRRYVEKPNTIDGQPYPRTGVCLDCNAAIVQYRSYHVRCIVCGYAAVLLADDAKRRALGIPPKPVHGAVCVDCRRQFQRRSKKMIRCLECTVVYRRTRARARWLNKTQFPREASCENCSGLFHQYAERFTWCTPCYDLRRAEKAKQERALLGSKRWRKANCHDCGIEFDQYQKRFIRCAACASKRHTELLGESYKRRYNKQFPRPAACVDCGVGISQGTSKHVRCAACADVYQTRRRRDYMVRMRKGQVTPVPRKAVELPPFDPNCYRCGEPHGRLNRRSNYCRPCAQLNLMDYRTQPKLRLRHAMSSRICHALERFNQKKSASWISTLPYTVEQLHTHLEKGFTRRMSWDNYGAYWVIDHIIPVASFTYESDSCPEFLACWALSNLRPWPSRDNLVKNAKRTHLV